MLPVVNIDSTSAAPDVIGLVEDALEYVSRCKESFWRWRWTQHRYPWQSGAAKAWAWELACEIWWLDEDIENRPSDFELAIMANALLSRLKFELGIEEGGEDK